MIVTSFPLIFNFRDLIAGQGFVASITTRGRLVLAEEAEGWTLYGVNPGGLAGGAEDRTAAFADFRGGYQSVLDDIAHEAKDFETFKASVERFVLDTNLDVGAEWERLRTLVRSGAINLDDMERDETEGLACTSVQLVTPKPDHDCEPTPPPPGPELNSEESYRKAA